MALSIAPSEFWLGNDGPWSTFNVHVGTPQQLMQVLPATSLSETLVVLSEGCPVTYPASCSSLRGGLFDPANSTDLTWSQQSPSDSSDQYFDIPFTAEQVLPNFTSIGAEVGFDLLVLDWHANGKYAPSTDDSLKGQLIAGYAASNPWLGMLGLTGIPSHIFTANLTNAQESALETLQNDSYIAGLNWAYTAGKRYTNPPLFGSLTFGGYDEARVDLNSAITVQFGRSSTLDLALDLTEITILGPSSPPVNGLGITVFIDSVVPEIWLPLEACQSFETAFGLVWDDVYEMYLVNDTQHANLVSQASSVTFHLAGQVSVYCPRLRSVQLTLCAVSHLGRLKERKRPNRYVANSTSATSVQIELPYAAFDLEAAFPLAGIQANGTSVRYFPLQRAANSSQYFLGRTFLQEAYVMADYDRQVFTIGPAVTTSASQIKVVYPPGYHTGLGAGAIAGIVVGSVAVLTLLAGLVFWLCRKRRKGEPLKGDDDTVRTRATSIGNTTIVGDVEMTDRQHMEYFKPPRESPGLAGEEFYKPELDATETATSHSGRLMERHELDAGSVRPGHRPQLSWGSSNGSGSGSGLGISPVGDDRRARSTFAEPSPPMYPSGSPSPPLSDRHHERNQSGGLFEML